MSLRHNGGLAVKAPSEGRCDPFAQDTGHKKGLRMVAVIEFLKGLLVVCAGLIFLEVIRKDYDLEDAAQNLLYYLHIDPDRRLSQVFVHAAARLMDADVRLVLGFAFVYAAGRFIESYGLWRQRVWAEWLAIISGAVYLPFELYKLITKPTTVHWLILLVNLAIVIYIAWVRWDDICARRTARRMRLAENGD